MATNKKPTAAKTAADKALAQYDYGEHSGAGFENQGKEDMLIQPIKLLQAQSPEVMDNDPTGAKAGMFLDPGNQVVYKELLFVPVLREHVFTEWVPREQGGGGGSGWVGEHEPDSDVVLKARAAAGGQVFGMLTHPESGNDLSETFKLHIVMQTPDGQYLPSLIIFDSTKIKVWKRGSQQRRAFQLRKPDGELLSPPLFAHFSKMSTTKERNDQGQWFNFKWDGGKGTVKDSLLGPTDPLFQAAASWYETVKAGQAKVSYENVDRAGGVDPADDNIPFMDGTDPD